MPIRLPLSIVELPCACRSMEAMPSWPSVFSSPASVLPSWLASTQTRRSAQCASLDLHALVGSTTNNGNLLGLTSSYTTTDGSTHAMADVWFAKDTTTTAAATTTTATPALSDLLAAPATDLLPGHTTDAAATVAASHAAAATHDASALHGLTQNRLLDDEQNRANPLI